MTICASVYKATIGPDNGLSPDWRQAIIWTNDGILLIGPLGTNFSEIIIKSHAFSIKKMYLKMSSGKWQPSCLELIVLSPSNNNNCSNISLNVSLDINLLIPGRSGWCFINGIFKLFYLLLFSDLMIMLSDEGHSDDEIMLVQVMAWCRQCLPNSVLPGQNEFMISNIFSLITPH